MRPVVAIRQQGNPSLAPITFPKTQLSTLIDLLVVFFFMGLLTFWSWEKWPDVFVDFGRELYVPWRLIEGDSLYSDIAYFNGPFSPYFNSLAFRAFGASIRTIHLVNLSILALIVVLIYFGLRVVSDRLTTLVGVFFFLSVFAFGQYLDIGNFNFIAPYSHEMTHGVLLSLLTLACAAIYLRQDRTAALAASGFFLGATLLTKAEFFLGSTCGLITSLAFQLWITRAPRRHWIRPVLTVMVGAMVAPVVAFCLLLFSHPPNVALPALLGTWIHVNTPGLQELAFYRESFGLDNPFGNLRSAFLWALGLTAFVAVGVLFAHWLKQRTGVRKLAVIVIAPLPWLVIFLGRETLEWGNVARTLPFLLAALFLSLLFLGRQQRDLDKPTASIPTWVLFTSFSLVLLSKMILNVRFHQYGFALAAPAALLAICVLISSIPIFLNRHRLWTPAFRVWCTSAVVGLACLHLVQTDRFFREKTVRVGTGTDSFWADSRGLFANRTLSRIQAHAADDATLAVLPEGVMINYLQRRVNPTPFINFMPPELLIFGEEAMIRSFDETLPDVILLVNRPAAEYGLKLLGRDYGEDLMKWVQENYSMQEQIREPTIEGQPYSFGLLLLPTRRPEESP